MAGRSWFKQAVLSAVLASCVGVPRHGAPRAYADSPFTSSGAACAQNPVYCATAAGVVLESGEAAAVGAAATLSATVIAVEALDLVTLKKVEDVLKECADQARSEVIIKHYGRYGPTPEDCERKIRGEVTQAMLLGEEMHRVASKCVDGRLGKVLPGRYSLEQRYRFDPATKKTTVLTDKEVEAIKRAGRWSELRGTIVPDVVIHKGDPRYVQAVYDFKFPCIASDELPSWRTYQDGPYREKTQEEIYKKLLGVDPQRIVPRLGVL